MKCPVDGSTLLIAERQDVEIDYCPDCRGVWLDRGELDKLVSRDRADHDDDDTDADAEPRRRDRRRDAHEQPRKKKGGWLSDIFELGG
jgi:Zn-finger nucleic acid-binding protein